MIHEFGAGSVVIANSLRCDYNVCRKLGNKIECLTILLEVTASSRRLFFQSANLSRMEEA